MTEESSFHDLTITVRLQVTDPAAVLSHPVRCFPASGRREAHVHVPGTIEEAVVARFTALLDQMYEPWAGLQVCEHSERLASWDRQRPQPASPGHPRPSLGTLPEEGRVGCGAGSSPPVAAPLACYALADQKIELGLTWLLSG